VTSILGDWKLDAALGSCLLLGLRHGFDYDHLAAISDITAVQRNWRTGLRLGMTYALGHAFTVAALGIAVLELHMGLPEGLDHWTERLIGLTLIVLGIGVVAGILRKDAHGHNHSRIESRLAIAINGVLWLAWQVRRCWNPQAPKPDRFQWMYTGKSVFLIGVLHGVGAETPSQLALFFLTANLGGTSRGIMGLAASSAFPTTCRRSASGPPLRHGSVQSVPPKVTHLLVPGPPSPQITRVVGGVKQDRPQPADSAGWRRRTDRPMSPRPLYPHVIKIAQKDHPPRGDYDGQRYRRDVFRVTTILSISKLISSLQQTLCRPRLGRIRVTG